MGLISGANVCVVEPCPHYVHQCMAKRHRKKRRITPRVKIFSHYVEVLDDGQVLHDQTTNVMYMNRRTYIEIRNSAVFDPQHNEEDWE
jgi:hypothetical protein